MTYRVLRVSASPHVDLAGDDGGDEGGAVLLQVLGEDDKSQYNPTSPTSQNDPLAVGLLPETPPRRGLGAFEGARKPKPPV